MAMHSLPCLESGQISGTILGHLILAATLGPVEPNSLGNTSACNPCDHVVPIAKIGSGWETGSSGPSDIAHGKDAMERKTVIAILGRTESNQAH